MSDPFKAKGKPAISVYVLRIRHRHGENLYVNHTKIGMQAALYGYVRENWDEGLTDQYGNLDSLSPQAAIDNYFECWGQGLDPECYEVSHEKVGR